MTYAFIIDNYYLLQQSLVETGFLSFQLMQVIIKGFFMYFIRPWLELLKMIHAVSIVAHIFHFYKNFRVLQAVKDNFPHLFTNIHKLAYNSLSHVQLFIYYLSGSDVLNDFNVFKVKAIQSCKNDNLLLYAASTLIINGFLLLILAIHLYDTPPDIKVLNSPSIIISNKIETETPTKLIPLLSKFSPPNIPENPVEGSGQEQNSGPSIERMESILGSVGTLKDFVAAKVLFILLVSVLVPCNLIFQPLLVHV